jgi:hypothetical protein
VRRRVATPQEAAAQRQGWLLVVSFGFVCECLRVCVRGFRRRRRRRRRRREGESDRQKSQLPFIIIFNHNHFFVFITIVYTHDTLFARELSSIRTRIVRENRKGVGE